MGNLALPIFLVWAWKGRQGMQSSSKSESGAPSLLFSLALCSLPLVINPSPTLNFNDVFLNIKAVWILLVVLPAATYLIYRNWGQVDRQTVFIFLFWLAWMGLSDIVNARGWLTLTGTPDRLQGLPIYLTYALTALAVYLWSKRDSRANSVLINMLGWLTLPLGTYVALQHYGLAGILNANATAGVSATIAGATLGNRGYLAGCMALLLPLVVTAATRSYLGVLGLFMTGFCLTASSTRGALLAALVGYILWLIQGNVRRYGCHAVLVLGLLAPLPHLTAGQADLRVFGSSADEQAITDASGRTPLWHTAVYGIRLRPLLGWGPGQLLNVMAQRPDTQLLQELGVPLSGRTAERQPRTQDAPLSWRLTGSGRRPEGVTESTNAVHNEYLEYAFNFGLPAALAFLGLFTLGFWRSWRVVPWAAASIAAYLVYLLTWPETIRFAPLAWAILGVALAAKFPRPSAKTESPLPPSSAS